jgi:hypothetical protein
MDGLSLMFLCKMEGFAPQFISAMVPVCMQIYICAQIDLSCTEDSSQNSVKNNQTHLGLMPKKRKWDPSWVQLLRTTTCHRCIILWSLRRQLVFFLLELPWHIAFSLYSSLPILSCIPLGKYSDGISFFFLEWNRSLCAFFPPFFYSPRFLKPLLELPCWSPSSNRIRGEERVCSLGSRATSQIP